MTPGRFPTRGVVGLSPTLDAHGVLTATVADLAHAWAALDPTEGRYAAPRLPCSPDGCCCGTRTASARSTPG
ncbi:hypothetical protein [Nocardioides zeae]